MNARWQTRKVHPEPSKARGCVALILLVVGMAFFCSWLFTPSEVSKKRRAEREAEIQVITEECVRKTLAGTVVIGDRVDLGQCPEFLVQQTLCRHGRAINPSACW